MHAESNMHYSTYRPQNYISCKHISRSSFIVLLTAVSNPYWVLSNEKTIVKEIPETVISILGTVLQVYVVELSQENVSLREDTYELCYNAACLLIGREEYKEALDKLQQAEGLVNLVYLSCMFYLHHLLLHKSLG